MELTQNEFLVLAAIAAHGDKPCYGGMIFFELNNDGHGGEKTREEGRVPRNTVYRVIDKLAARGFVARRRNQSIRGVESTRSLFALTEEGKGVFIREAGALDILKDAARRGMDGLRSRGERDEHVG